MHQKWNLSKRKLILMFLIPLALALQKGHTHSNKSLECVWPFYGAGA